MRQDYIPVGCIPPAQTIFPGSLPSWGGSGSQGIPPPKADHTPLKLNRCLWKHNLCLLRYTGGNKWHGRVPRFRPLISSLIPDFRSGRLYPPTHKLILTSGSHYWKPVQTCSFEYLHPAPPVLTSSCGHRVPVAVIQEDWQHKNWTRLHSSRIRTARTLTVGGGGGGEVFSRWGGVLPLTLAGGVYFFSLWFNVYWANSYLT